MKQADPSEIVSHFGPGSGERDDDAHDEAEGRDRRERDREPALDSSSGRRRAFPR